MRTYKCKIDDLGETVNKILTEYADDVAEGTKEAVKAVAKIAKQETQAGSPVGSGKYKRGWTVREENLSRIQTSAIVHNRSAYQLAHLLEKGHALVKGGRTIGQVKAIPHIEKAERKAIKNLEEAIRQIAER